jgi:hypothetical protein
MWVLPWRGGGAHGESSLSRLLLLLLPTSLWLID